MENATLEDAIQFFLIPHRFIHALMFDHVVPVEYGLNKTDIRTLMALRFHETISMKKLGNGVGMAKGSFTQVIDKLVRAGMADRSSNPRDRRMVMVRITEKGKQTAGELDKELRIYMEKRLKVLKMEERHALQMALETIEKITTTLDEERHENG